MLLEWLGMAGEGVSGLAGLSQVGVLGGGGGEGDGLTVCLGRCWSPVPSGCTRGLLSSGSEAVLDVGAVEAHVVCSVAADSLAAALSLCRIPAVSVPILRFYRSGIIAVVAGLLTSAGDLPLDLSVILFNHASEEAAASTLRPDALYAPGQRQAEERADDWAGAVDAQDGFLVAEVGTPARLRRR